MSDSDIIGAGMPRKLPGALFVLISTPWAAPSETDRLFSENLGHPISGIAARASTLLMHDNDSEIATTIARERKRSPSRARLENDCIVDEGMGGGVFLEPSAIGRCISSEPIVRTNQRASAGIDPAFVSDGFALVVVERQDGRLAVVHHEIVVPEPNRRLFPSEVVSRFATRVKSFNCFAWATDSHRVATVREHAAHEYVETAVLDTEASRARLREVMREGRLRIPSDPVLLAQLRAVVFRARTGGGIHAFSPRSNEGGHADLVSALAMAVLFDDRRFGPLGQDASLQVPMIGGGPRPPDAFVPGTVDPFGGNNANPFTGGFRSQW